MGTEMETSGNRTALGVSSDIAQLIGNRLRRARESIGRSTSALSAKIKVREHYLVAIEDGQWNELPPGLNGRGLVRIYARELSVSVPELDQGANQSVMPAEQDAQAPYQVSQKREPGFEREASQVRVSEISQPVQQRSADFSSRTNTLNSVQRPSKSGDVPPFAENRKSSASHQYHKVIESTPEEEPLDVVTPDVASILGITLDIPDEMPKKKMAAPSRDDLKVVEALAQTIALEQKPTASASLDMPKQSSVNYDDIPQVSAIPDSAVINASDIHFEVAQSEVAQAPEQRVEAHSVKKSKKHGKHRQEKSVALNDSRATATSESGKSEQTISAVDTVTVSQAHLPSTAHETAPLVTEVEATSSLPKESSAPIASAHEPVEQLATPVQLKTEPAVADSAGVLAAEAYLKSHVTEVGVDQAPEQNTAQKTSTPAIRWAVGLMAACAGIFIITQAFLRTGDHEAASEATSEVKVAEEQKAAENGAATDAPSGANEKPPEVLGAVTVGDSKAPSDMQNKPSDVPSETAPQSASAQGDLTATTVAKPPAAAPVESQVAPTEVEATAAQTETDEATESNSQGANRVAEMAGSTLATLTLSESLDIQVTADGKKVFSGKHNAGKIEIKFNKRAEIFVQDGSKARLRYAGWDHGALGQAGRKRRIVLNAESFSGVGN